MENKLNRIERNVTWDEFNQKTLKLFLTLQKNKKGLKYIYGIPKGGLPLAVTLANLLKLELILDKNKLKSLGSKCLVVDDISDSGSTLKSLHLNSNVITCTLFIRKNTTFTPTYYCEQIEKEWLVFPHEKILMKVN